MKLSIMRNPIVQNIIGRQGNVRSNDLELGQINRPSTHRKAGKSTEPSRDIATDYSGPTPTTKKTGSSISDTVELHEQGLLRRCIGNLGLWQYGQICLIFLSKFSVAWQQLGIIFISPPINFTCESNPDWPCDPNCTKYIYDRSVFTNTVSMTWDLVCERKLVSQATQAIGMVGILIGNLVFGILSDFYGRRRPICWGIVIEIVAGCFASVANSLVVFVCLRFISAMASGGVMVVSFVLLMEIIGVDWRTLVCVASQIPFVIGNILLPCISYVLRDWRDFLLITSVSNVVLLTYICLLTESPRWLLVTNQPEKAIEVLEYAAKKNNLLTAHISPYVNNYINKRKYKAQHVGTPLDLIRTPVLRRSAFWLSLNWFMCGICLYGTLQYVGQLEGNIFLNVVYSGTIQIPSIVFVAWALSALGRKLSLIVANLVGGLGALVIIAIGPEPAYQRVLACCLSIFGFTQSHVIVYIYAGELFPTKIRNVGVGGCSLLSKIGSILAPYFATAGHEHDWLPPTVFGTCAFLGVIAALFLPETVDCMLPETIEDAERLSKKQWKWSEN